MVVTLQDARFLSHGEMHKDEENSTGELKALNTPTPDNTNGQARERCVSQPPPSWPPPPPPPA
jgi:hypothetical protein